MLRRSFLFGFVAAVALSFAGAPAEAGSLVGLPQNLADLIANDDYFDVGVLRFSDFEVTITGNAAIKPTAADFEIKEFIFGPEYGFTLVGGIFAGPGEFVDVLLEYTVTALGDAFIEDAFISAATQANNGGGVTIAEGLFDGITPIPGTSNFGVDTFVGKNSDLVFFEPVKSINVQKDIFLIGGANGTASVSAVNQGFSLTVVPEPASMALMGIGLSGLLVVRRFRKRAA